ncbi:MAG: hypothetical protein Q8O68_01080 [Candidatus Daviesbacteria bacterium]|nr:hypothetical protein [Candidatus Daviesbacteria bacterium]
MNPEKVSPEQLNDFTNKSDLSSIVLLKELPGATVSFLKTVFLYRKFHSGLTPELQKLSESGPAMLMSVWAYTIVSDRDLETLEHEGVLLPFLMLYNTLANQDDILDLQREKGVKVEAKTAFWHQPEYLPNFNPLASFKAAIKSISENGNLSAEAKHAIKSRIATAYSPYVAAEDTLGELVNQPFELFDVFKLRVDSFGAMSKALTALLNGNSCVDSTLIQRNEEIENTMAWFMLAAEIIDSELDVNEDTPITVSVPIAANKSDRESNRPIGTTIKYLVKNFLQLTGSTQIASFMLTARNLYPKLKVALAMMEKVIKRPFRLTLATNDDPVLHR